MVAGLGSHQVRATDSVGGMHTVRCCLDCTVQLLSRAGYPRSHLAVTLSLRSSPVWQCSSLSFLVSGHIPAEPTAAQLVSLKLSLAPV